MEVFFKRPGCETGVMVDVGDSGEAERTARKERGSYLSLFGAEFEVEVASLGSEGPEIDMTVG